MGYHCYQLQTKLYPLSFFQGEGNTCSLSSWKDDEYRKTEQKNNRCVHKATRKLRNIKKEKKNIVFTEQLGR
jgi:hypothetical protein